MTELKHLQDDLARMKAAKAPLEASVKKAKDDAKDVQDVDKRSAWTRHVATLTQRDKDLTAAIEAIEGAIKKKETEGTSTRL